MSNFSLRNCIFAFKCSQTWESLDETRDENVRFCNDCEKEVHYCSNDQELVESVRLNRCVAFSRNQEIHEMGYIVEPEYQKQEILPEEVRSQILKKIMMLKSWFEENMDKELTRNEYNYIAENLLKQTGFKYSNRDLFDLQVWAFKVPALPGKWYREDSINDDIDFDDNIIEFMNSVGLNWDYWHHYQRKKS
jgi:hypothetical protein